jgi:hypothetical protein
MDSRTGKRHDATGRSTGEVIHYGGRAKRWKFEEGFIGEPMSLLESPGYQALNFPAFKILAFLKLEHCRQGGAENGRLMAPHRQLQALGISPRKIKPALAMLEAFGIIRLTTDGERLGGRPNAARYALTWLPTCDGRLPTEGYKRITSADVRCHLRNAAQAPTSEGDPPTQVKAIGTKSGQNAYTSEGGTADTSEGTIYILGARPPVDGVAGRGAEPSNSAASRPAARSAASAEPLSSLPIKIGLEIASANDGQTPDQSSLKRERA